MRSAAAGAAQHAREPMKKPLIWIMLSERFYDDVYRKWRACRVPPYHYQRSSIGGVRLSPTGSVGSQSRERDD